MSTCIGCRIESSCRRCPVSLKVAGFRDRAGGFRCVFQIFNEAGDCTAASRSSPAWGYLGSPYQRSESGPRRSAEVAPLPAPGAFEDQVDQALCVTLVTNVAVLWTATYLGDALAMTDGLTVWQDTAGNWRWSWTSPRRATSHSPTSYTSQGVARAAGPGWLRRGHR